MTAVATSGALLIDLVSYQSFLLLLGSVFVPLFAVLLDWGIGATVPSFLVASVLAGVVATLSRRPAVGAAPA